MAEFIPFRFVVKLHPEGDDNTLLAQGAFSEVSGLELSMSPVTVKEGGRNWGEVQLAGRTTFSNIVLKRGVTHINDLYSWMDITSRQANYAYRMTGFIEVYDHSRLDDDNEAEPLLRWKIERAMPTKFKGPDLSATASAVAVEELTLVHEGLELERRESATPRGNASSNNAAGGANDNA